MIKLIFAILMPLMTSEAFAVYKCVVNNLPVFQDAPCANTLGTVGQAFQRKETEESYYVALDRLQATGKGMTRSTVRLAQPLENKEGEKEDTYFRAQRGTRDSRNAEVVERLTKQTAQTNESSVVRMTVMFEEAKRRCGGSMKDEPQLGMTEEIFRHCTKSTRFGNVSEVVSERIDSKELRLFIMPNSSFKRIYMIDGIVTKMK
jgi:hypothetical protein